MTEQPSIHQFYTDRRNRKMTDPMIVHELEAGGWTLPLAQAAVAQARTTYIAAPDAEGLVQTTDSITYTLQKLTLKALHRKYGLRVVGIGIVAGLAAYSEVDPGSAWWVALLWVIGGIGVGYAATLSKNAKYPMRVVLTASGIQLTSKGKTVEKPYSRYAGLALPSTQSTWFTRVLGLGGTTSALETLENIQFQSKPSALETRGQIAFVLAVPPEHYTKVKAFLLAHLPAASQKAQVSKKLWKAIGFILFVSAGVLLLAIYLLNQSL